MLKVKVIAVLSFVLVAFSTTCFAGEKKFDAEKFKDLAKIAEDYVKADCKVFRKKNIKKIAITECYGEFLLSKEVQSGALDKRWGSWSTETKSSISLGGDYYAYATDRFCSIVKKIFVDNGIEVVAPEVVTNNETYKGFKLDEEKKGGGYTGSVISNSVTTETIKRSASGLGIYPGAFGMLKVAPKLARACNELGAQALVRVNFYVDKGKKGTPLIKDFKVTADGLPFDDHGGWYFNLQNHEMFKLDTAITSTVDISGAEKNSVDLKKYDDALFEILNAIAGMSAEELKAELAKK